MFLGSVFPVWPGQPCLIAVIAEDLHYNYMEEKHAQDVQSFHVVRIFHLTAVRTNAARLANKAYKTARSQSDHGLDERSARLVSQGAR